MASRFIGGVFREFTNSGAPLSGGLLYTYEAGTTTPLATYTTRAGNVANPNPVVLDSAGRASVWLGPRSYRMICKTSAGVTLWDEDGISEASSSDAPPNLESSGYVSKLWTYKMPGTGSTFSSVIGPVTLGGDACVVFGGLDNYVYALKVSDGTLKWRTATGDQVYGRCQAADVVGTSAKEVIAGSHDGKIWCLNDSGTMVWQFQNLYDREGSGTSTAATATTMTDSGKTWAANAFLRVQGVGYGASLRFTSGPASGQSREITGNPGGSVLTVASAFSPAPTAGGGDTYVIDPKYASDKYFQHAGTLVNESGSYYLYACGFDNHVYKINAATGALVWKYATLENIEAYPLVVTVSGALRCIANSIDGKVRSLNASTGALVWEQSGAGKCDAFMYAADVNGDSSLELICASRDGRVYVLNISTGAILYTSTYMRAWDYGDVDCAAVPVTVDGEIRIVTGGDAGTLWCLDSQANTLWQRFLLPNVINATPVVHDVFGNGAPCIIAGDVRGVLHCLNASDGSYAGAWYTKGIIEGMPLYGDLDGDGAIELVVATGDGYVTCYRFLNGAAVTPAGYPTATQWTGSQ